MRASESILRTLVAAVLFAAPVTAQTPAAGVTHPGDPAFLTSDRCIACHRDLQTPEGVDISIGPDWRASMMANSARDPYWQAAVRRETASHPSAAAGIEAECSICHMPMAHATELVAGRSGSVFAHTTALPPSPTPMSRLTLLAQDGVSCTLCHQVSEQGLGTPASFVGNFVVRGGPALGMAPRIYGPFTPDTGRLRVMRSATGYDQTQATHLQRAEMCSACHTLYTHAFDEHGNVSGELPEQVPFLEWEHSDFADRAPCQSCHMPPAARGSPVASVMGQPRDSVSRHFFMGGNFFMLRIFERFGAELGVRSPPDEIARTVLRTIEHLASSAARVSIERLDVVGEELRATVAVENLAGHKLPTAYPSRRVWLHVTVRDASGAVVFESGALEPDGSIRGNDNDVDATRFEPHWRLIERADQVQIWEPILGDPRGRPTTGLLTATQYLKDNRLLPTGFDKTSAHADVAVRGEAATDPDFTGGSDRIEYVVDVSRASAPLRVETELLYQPIGFRWARDVASQPSFEGARFARFYEALADESATTLAQTERSVQR